MYQSKSKKPSNIIAYNDDNSYEESFNELKQKILKNSDKSDIPAAERMQILEDFSACEMGKYLIQYRILNGTWSRYITLYPQNGKLTGLSSDGKPLSDFERWTLERCPLALATQERFFTFQKLLQSKFKDGMKVLSIPCGLMDDLLGLNYHNMRDFKLLGVDMDKKSLELALENAIQNNLQRHCEFIEADPWNLQINDHFDIITSNGLNIYEPDDERVEMVYSKIYKLLKPGGTLINSFFTPPPTREQKSEWDASQISGSDLRMQSILLGDILNVKWIAAHRSAATVHDSLKDGGFKDINIIYDRQKLFPTVVAIK